MYNKSILINVNSVENCWEKDDATFVEMKSGKIWICDIYVHDTETSLTTIRAIQQGTGLVRLTLKDKKGKCDRNA